MTNKLAVGVILTSLLTTLTTPALASNTSPTLTRLAGLDRYQTANEIAKSGWTTSTYAFLAYGENYPDALAAATLAKRHEAPILLTGQDAIPEETLATLKSLGVREVYIVGGTGVISQNIEKQLRDKQIMSSRLAGVDRYETAVRIAEKNFDSKKIIVTTGDDYADALSAGSVAGIENAVILLVPKDNLPESVKAYLAKHPNTEKTYVIGNTDIISDEVANQFPNMERITGADKYERNLNIVKKFEADFSQDGVYLATGENFADALTGTALAAKTKHPILLLPNGTNIATSQYLSTKALTKLTALGGEAVVSNDMVKNYCPDVATNGTPTNNDTPSKDVSTDDFVTYQSTAWELNLPVTFWYNGEKVKFTSSIPTNELNNNFFYPIDDYAKVMGFTYVVEGNKVIFHYKGTNLTYDIDQVQVQIKDGIPYMTLSAMFVTFYKDKPITTFGADSNTRINWAIDPDLVNDFNLKKLMDVMYADVPISYYLTNALLLPHEKVVVKAKVDEITEGLTSDMDKFKAIVTWVAENTYYTDGKDTGFDRSGMTGTFAVFLRHVTECTGYSSLTACMLELAGIPARLPYTDEHTWTEAYIDGQWIDCDATWASNNRYYNGEFDKGELNPKYLTDQPTWRPRKVRLII